MRHGATKHNLVGCGLNTHGTDSPSFLSKSCIRIFTHVLITRTSVMGKECWESGFNLRTAHALRCPVGWKSKKNLTKVSVGARSDCLSRDNRLPFCKETFFAPLALWPYAYASSFVRFLYHTRRTTFFRTPLDE